MVFGFCPRGHLEHRSGSIQAVQARHGEIEDGHIGAEDLGEPEGFTTVRRLADDFEPLPLQERLETLADDGVIVGQDDSKGHGGFRQVHERRLAGG
jgi:hypothetical protein